MFSNPILLIGLATLALYFIGKYSAKGDTAVEERRRGAISLVTIASKNGLNFLSPLLEDYAVGDYSGMVKELSKMRNALHDPVTMKQVTESFLTVQFQKYAETDEGRKAIIALVEKNIDTDSLVKFADYIKTKESKEVADVTTTSVKT